MPDLTEAEQIGAYAQEAQEPHPVERGELVVIAGCVRDLSDYDDHPRRTHRNAITYTAQGLIQYHRHHGTTGSTLYVNTEGAELLIVLDGDEPKNVGDELGWGDHTAELKLRTSPEWDHWKRLDGQLVEQSVMAQHFEDGLAEIITPDGATMLELAQSMEATTSSTFRQGERLATGERRFQFSETVDGKAGRDGLLTIPETFQLQLPVFLGSTYAQAITARFRYKLRDGHLQVGYRLVRPMDGYRAEVDAIATEVASATELDAIAGWPVS